jgi:hypothetical protein
LDGVLDLIQDYNNVEQSFFLIQWLKKITKKFDLLVLLVLHLGKKDQNSLGHIGSYLDRKSQSVLKIEKNKENNTLNLSPQFLRSSEDFNPVSIMYQGGAWYQVDSDKKTSDYIFGIEKITLLNKVLDIPKSYTQLISDLSEITGKANTSIKKQIKNWLLDGTIIKVDNLYKKK